MNDIIIFFFYHYTFYITFFFVFKGKKGPRTINDIYINSKAKVCHQI